MIRRMNSTGYMVCPIRDGLGLLPMISIPGERTRYSRLTVVTCKLVAWIDYHVFGVASAWETDAEETKHVQLSKLKPAAPLIFKSSPFLVHTSHYL